MKTLKQIISEAKAETKEKKPTDWKRASMKIEPDEKMFGTAKNPRGVEYGFIHVHENIPKESKQEVSKRLDDMGGYGPKKTPVDRSKNVGAFIGRDGKVSFFENARASHGQAKQHVDIDNPIPATVSWNSRDHAHVEVHGNEPLDKDTENAIVNHEGLNRMFGKVSIKKV